ncbi:Alpha/Beta hydrolase protein [Fusarium oxysporum II5]|nr:Alpha/Beta hydrolase protein [Fusarium oxysporum II5]
MKHSILGILLALITGAVSKPPLLKKPPTVQVKNGTYIGTHSNSYNQDFFLGIPYAQPPVRNLRFNTAQSLNTTWTGKKPANSYSAACIGYGSEAIGKPIIGISLNYRLGALGFLNSDEVAKTGNTNLGFKDQRLALRWVQENIPAFGGDPEQVTIWGESAGAFSVGAHLTAFGGRDDRLFRGAIMDSGNPVFYLPVFPAQYFQPSYEALLRMTGCNNSADGLQCLRQVPIAELSKVFHAAPSLWSGFTPSKDGDFIQGSGSELLSKGKFVHVTILIGTNTDEGTYFASKDPTPKNISSDAEFISYLQDNQHLPTPFIQEVQRAYPDVPSEGIPGVPTLPTSYRPGYPYGSQWRRLYVYSYRFNIVPASIPGVFGASHVQEIPFAFYNHNGIGYNEENMPPWNGTKEAFEDKGADYAEAARLMSSFWPSGKQRVDLKTPHKKSALFRKLRCDRESPCGSCVRRRDIPSCSYEVSPDNSERDRVRQAQAQARLEHLEHLVEMLAGQRSATNDGAQNATLCAVSPPDPGIAEHATASSSLRSDLCYQTESGTTHWSAMLDDIQALRSTLDSFEDNSTDAEDVSAPQSEAGMGIGVMFGAGLSQALSIEQVLNTHLPSRRDTDRLVSAYFRVRLYITPFIHAVQFRRQYEAFWNDPAAASPLWISILFSMLFMAANISRTSRENEVPGHGFTVAAAQCLALGEYFRPKPFCFEALLLYLQSRFVTCLEISPDMGTLLSMLAHIATVSGYHRESSVPGISPFAAEMRRRAWSMFVQLDLLVSFHLGVPSRISLSVSNTRAPSNLLDSDFDEDSTQLPTSRANTELTGVTFCILKHRLMTIFDKIFQHVLMDRLHEAKDSEIDALDTELKGLYKALPELYQPRPIENCIIDHPQLIVARLCISFVYYKCLCVLHRPHVTRHRDKSVRECYAASSALVTDLLRVYEECKPGGQLDTEEWLMKSITWHDFLLGVTTLCLVAYATNQATDGIHIDEPGTKLLLERARTVIQMEQSEDGARARSRVLSIVEATVAHLEVQQSSECMQVLSDMDTLPPINTLRPSSNVTEGSSWKWGETQLLNETNWDYLDELFDISHH